MDSLNIFNFPAKKLKNTGAVITHALFMFIHSVSNICSIVVNFPAKRLRKIRCLKIRMRRIFFFLHIFNKVYFYFHVLELYLPEKS